MNTDAKNIIKEVLSFMKDKAINDPDLNERVAKMIQKIKNENVTSAEIHPTDWVFDFLQGEGKPHQTSEIIRAMVSDGAASDEYPVMALSAQLRRDNRFQYIPDEGWIIKPSTDIEPFDEISKDRAERLAKYIVENMDHENINTLNRHRSIGGVGLPHSVDLEMLRTFKSTYKRLATESEKKLLRESILEEIERD
ncbi:MAG: hypothetical protein GDA36_08870 [Rhodobacteraceae bacterium]|nr:hypothetical protein [Paracoccaceae bacterium]